MARMPRIDADTVAEHRIRQHDALLDAALDIVLHDGYDALNFRVLGQRTGLARNSIYRYFTSRDDIIGELCEREMPAWLHELAAALDQADSLEDKAAAYTTSQLRMVAAGRHRLAHALSDAPLGVELRARIATYPDQAAALLERALADGGHPRPHLRAQLVTGVLNAAFRLMGRGQDAEVIAATADTARRAVSHS
jgi:AcrR family transcriptional regulator